MMKNLSFLLLVFLSRAKANFEMGVTGALDQDDNTQYHMEVTGGFDFEGLTSSCGSMTDCGACTNTYSCHWCSHDNACHAKGSWRGCSWGATCSAPEPQGCTAHTTCSDCALASHTCHWCAFDNACHAVGSPHGCAAGVDCYSNEICRRKEPQKFQRIVTEMPMGFIAFVVLVSFVLIVSLSLCLGLLGTMCGGYQDVDSTNEPASTPSSITGINMNQMAATDPAYTAVATEAPEGSSSQMEQGENINGPAQQTGDDDGIPNQDQSTIVEGTDDPMHPLDVAGSSSNYVQMAENAEEEEPNETARLLEDPPGIIATPPPTGPRRMRKVPRTCRMIQIVSVLLVLLLASMSVYFFPVMPTFSVCNDSIGWRRIIEHIIAMRIDASFEVLISLSNKNRIAVALDRGNGTFQFDGRPLGTFVIPPVTVESMAISDLMILAKASPDRHQALKIVQAFRNGHLILDADFDATIRLPWFFNYTRNITVNHYLVDVTAPKDRTLCQCQDDTKNSTTPEFLLDLIPEFDELMSDLDHENDSSFVHNGEVAPYGSQALN
ncbi:unnamed protein product [Cylindrotheca closterium]|uniref:Uncharacterized protein n=1 Tax=Cylindrotheca closterium TaxID=2856 RepID=A0AAD2G024_9STRA|nr:unnamed protein product [Cylindrotheca closterium]